MITHKLNFNNFAWLEKHKGILEILSQNGEEARFVGGAVKNSLLSIPIGDFDVATSNTPEQVVKICQDLGLTVIPTGLSHGTVTVLMNGTAYEVTTLRTDVTTDGRHAQVAFTRDWSHDAERRDFTINAVYLDKNGEFLDYFNGLDDLENGIIRFIGSAEKRIQEDYLRILRFFRFFIGYGIGDPDAEGLFYCRKYARCLVDISIERITKEFLTFLSYDNVENMIVGIKCMGDCGIFSVIFDKHFHKVHDLANFISFVDFEKELRCGSSNLLKLMFLSPNYWTKLRLSNKQIKHIKSLNYDDFLQNHNLSIISQNEIQNIETLLKNIKKEKVFSMLYQYGNTVLRDLFILYLYYAKVNLSHGFSGDIGSIFCAFLDEITHYVMPVFPLSGADLMNFNIEAGKKMGDILHVAKQYWLNNNCYSTKEDCLNFLKNNSYI